MSEDRRDESLRACLEAARECGLEEAELRVVWGHDDLWCAVVARCEQHADSVTFVLMGDHCEPTSKPLHVYLGGDSPAARLLRAALEPSK